MAKRVSTAVILAAGLGSRLKDRTKERPKAFLEVGNKTLIERSIENLLDVGVTKIVIGTGYLHHFFDGLATTYPMVTTVINNDFADTGSMYTLYNLHPVIEDDFLLLESDLLYEKKALHALVNDPHQDMILASGQTKSNDEVYIEVNNEGCLVNMSKSKEVLQHIDGELVGISKVSLSTYRMMCDYAAAQYTLGDRAFHYEDDFVAISGQVPIHIKKIDDLAWCEIDDEQHLQRALTHIYPKIIARDQST